MSESHPLTFLCLASHFKGGAFMQAAKQLGHHVLVLAAEKDQAQAWPRESIDEIFFMPALSKQPDITYAVSYLARGHDLDAIIALDDFDVETAAALREHMRLPGMGTTLARNFRDKLAMRTSARAGGVLVPDFVGVFNYDRLRDFMARVPPPWVLKPRSEASSMGIKKMHDSEQLWRTLDTLGDQQSFFLLEQFVPGEVFHVDALVDNGEALFVNANQYSRPPMSVYQDGGVFSTHNLDRDSANARALFEINARTLKALGMVRGANHAEFIRAQADGRFYFLECASRVGGANIAEATEFATGINLWREWARIEEAHLTGRAYQLPERRHNYGGIIQCLARQEWPDTSAYTDPEIVWRLQKKQHAGLIVSSPDAARVEALIRQYIERFTQDFLAVAPPLESVTQMH
jgi:biotin carboxylase